MLNRYRSLFTVLVIAAAPAGTQAFQKGLGIILGQPTGITFRYHIDPVNAIDTATVWSLAAQTVEVKTSVFIRLLLPAMNNTS